MRYSKTLLAAGIFVFAGASACQAKTYQDFAVVMGYESYVWPIGGASISVVSDEPLQGNRSLKISGGSYAGAGIGSSTEQWNFDCQPELNDRLSFWIYGYSPDTVSVRFFDWGNYHADGFEVWTTQTILPNQWTQLYILFSQLPPDFDLHHIDKIQIVNYSSGTHYIGRIEVLKDDRIYQSFEAEKRYGSVASEFGWKWNDADAVGLSAPGEPVLGDQYSWKLVAAERWSGFGLQSQEKKLVVNPDGSSYQDFWHVDMDPAHNTLLSFWVYGLPLNQMDNNVSIQFYDWDQHNTDDTKVVYWTKVAGRVGNWTRLIVPFDELLKQPDASNLHLDNLNKIQVQVYWPGTYYFDEFHATTPIPTVDMSVLPLGQIQWQVQPGTYRLYESNTGSPTEYWQEIWCSCDGANVVQNGHLTTSKLTPTWYRLNNSDPIRYEPAIVTIDSAALRNGSVSWRVIPQADIYEVQSAPAKNGPWSRFYLGPLAAQPAHPGDWYRVRPVHLSDDGQNFIEVGSWGPAISDTTETGFVRADRTDLREQNGLGGVVMLRGANLGGVFINEPWMTGLGDSDNPKIPDDFSLRQTLESRFGAADAKLLLDTYQQTYLQEWDFDALFRYGFNTVRLPIYYRQFEDESGNWILNNQGQIDFSAVDRIIKFCADRGMYVVLDLHGAPGSQNNEMHSGREGYNKLFENSLLGQSYRDRTVALWEELARHYKDETTIAGFDLLNEPVGAAALSDLWALYGRLYDAIRAIDANHLIIMEGAYDWNTLPSPASQGWENVLYQFHYYLFGFSEDLSAHQQFIDSQVAQAEIKQREYQVPSMIGEFNGFSMKPIWDYYLNAINRHGWSWMPWNYKFHNSPSDWGLYTHAYFNEDEPKLATDSLADLTRKLSKYDTANHHAPNQALIELLSQATGAPINHAPVLSPISNKTIKEGRLLSFAMSATDSDGDAVTFKAVQLPVGATITGNLFSWTPDFNQAGSVVITFIASDGGLEDSQDVTITVSDAPLAVRSLHDSQDPFSPNNDGVQDTTTITTTFNHTITAGKLVITNAANQGINGWVTQGPVTSLQQVWDGKDAQGNVVPDGLYTYKVIGKDAGDSVATQSGTITVATPDLTVISLTHNPLNPAAGTQVTITAVVKNIGAAKVAGSVLKVQVGAAVYTNSVPSLTGGATRSISRKVALATGNYPVTATIDPSNLIAEKNESNNILTDSITVQ